MHLTDKIIVVTGGGNGIGRALSLQLVREGARVAAVDINGETLQETQALAGPHAGRISLHMLDVSDRPAVESLPEQVLAAHGAVDGLINNAGIAQPLARVSELPYETIERVLGVNLYGPLYMVKAFLPHLRQRPVAHVLPILG